MRKTIGCGLCRFQRDLVTQDSCRSAALGISDTVLPSNRPLPHPCVHAIGVAPFELREHFLLLLASRIGAQYAVSLFAFVYGLSNTVLVRVSTLPARLQSLGTGRKRACASAIEGLGSRWSRASFRVSRRSAFVNGRRPRTSAMLSRFECDHAGRVNALRRQRAARRRHIPRTVPERHRVVASHFTWNRCGSDGRSNHLIPTGRGRA